MSIGVNCIDVRHCGSKWKNQFVLVASAIGHRLVGSAVHLATILLITMADSGSAVPPWRNSPARKLLAANLRNGTYADEMSAAEIFQKEAVFRLYPYKRFQANLRSLRVAIKEEDPNLPPWEISVAKEKLLIGLKDGTIAYDADPKMVYESDDDYKRYPFRKFKPNFARLCDEAKKQKKDAKFCAAALEHDRKLFPKPSHGTFNYRSVPRWEGSAAEKALKDDVASNKSKTMTPSTLYHSRPCYRAFPQRMFTKHIHQAEDHGRFINSCDERTNKKKAKKDKKRAEYG